MLCLKLTWWLWNQMFQYSFIRALSLWNNEKFLLDTHNLKDRPYSLNIFNIQEKFATKKHIPWYENIWWKWFLSNIIFWIKRVCKHINPDHHYEYSNTIIDKIFWLEMEDLKKTIKKLSKIKSWYIEWLFQSEEYFKAYKNEILEDFTFKKEISIKTKNIEQIMKDTDSVGIHIRRWDYLQKYRSNLLWTKWVNYYEKCISFIKNKIEDPSFFFISDDPKRCMEHFKNLWNSYFIDWNNWANSWQDMYLLSKCKHNIIWNSTFAWRWAYLNNNKNKIVIAPKKWDAKNEEIFKLIIPSSRIKL